MAMSIRHRAHGALMFAALWLVCHGLVAPALSLTARGKQASRPLAVPSPRSVLGFDPGEDRKLAGWSQIVDYFKRLDDASPRVEVHQAGLSTEKRPFIYALISSEENIKNLRRIQENQAKLADPRTITSQS